MAIPPSSSAPTPPATGSVEGKLKLTGDLGGTAASPTVVAIESATTSVNVGSATAPTTGQVLTATGSTAATWQTPAGGGGLPTRLQTYAFLVYLSVGYTPSSFTSDITFNRALWNYGTQFDIVTNNNYTAPVNGLYRFDFAVQQSSKILSSEVMGFDINSFTTSTPTREWATSTETDTLWGGWDIQLSANDTVAIYQTTKAPILGGNPYANGGQTWFSGRLVAT